MSLFILKRVKSLLFTPTQMRKVSCCRLYCRMKMDLRITSSPSYRHLNYNKIDLCSQCPPAFQSPIYVCKDRARQYLLREASYPT